jgi:two-component system cell cycle sensor histidine kinase/response regulator CckA
MSVLGAIARTLGLRGNPQASRAVLDSAFDAIIVMKPSGAIVDLNAAAEGLFGHSRDKAIGQELASLIVPPDRSEAHRKVLLDYDPSRPSTILGQRIEVEAVRSDGLRLPIELSVARVDDADGVLLWAWIRDLTERRMSEDALRQSDMQLRQSLKMEAIGRLAGGVAHDFNNVLTAIFGYADLLLDGFDANHPSRSDVLEIKKAGERAAILTRQLLAFSRKQVLQTRPVDLNEVVNTMAPLLARLVGEGIKLEIAVDPGLDVVQADPGQLDQVLMNLAANARDAMPDGGRLRIATVNEDVSAGQASQQEGVTPGRYVRLAVTDTGHGIPKDVLRQIFEPFFTTKEQGKGTGLGLATVYGIVKQSNGWIDASSELGEGTTFAIHLPSVVPRATPTSSL